MLAIVGVGCAGLAAGAGIEFVVQAYEIEAGARTEFDKAQIGFVGVATGVGAGVATALPFLAAGSFEGAWGYFVYATAASIIGEITEDAIKEAFGADRPESLGTFTVKIGADAVPEGFAAACGASDAAQLARLGLAAFGSEIIKPSYAIELGDALVRLYQQWEYDSAGIYEDWFNFSVQY